MKTRLSQEQKDYFLRSYMENELPICLSYNNKDRLKYLGAVQENEIEEILYKQANETVNYMEDVIEGYDDMYVECLNPNIKEQSNIVIIDDSNENKLRFLNVKKEDLLKYVSKEYIEFEIRSWNYTFSEGYYHLGSWYPHNDRLKAIVDEILS